MNTSILTEELAKLNAQIEQTRQKHESLEGELRVVEAELETFAADRQRFDLLRNVCDALVKLGELKADQLFWEGVAEPQNVAGHLERAKSRIDRFDGQIGGILKKRESLQSRINGCFDELDRLDQEVRNAHAREQRRQQEWVVDREISEYPHRLTLAAESEQRFRRDLLIALIFFICFSALMQLWIIPPPPRPTVAEVQRMVAVLKKEPPKPEPPKPKEEKKPEKEQEDRPKPTEEETKAARKKAESSGVLAFKESFKDLMAETPAARLGVEARVANPANVAAGQARASRSLIAMQSTAGSSGGIANAGISRSVGSPNGSGIGAVGFTRVESSVAGMKEETRKLTTGPGPARTDEEIQIVFDRYKATLYRMYNAELRKNPALRGKIILRITIEPGGEVSACTVQSNDLGSPELVAQILERVKKFNFGPKEKVSKTVILYPIDFLPGS